MPTLFDPLRAGKLPPAAEDGRTYMQVPINAFALHQPAPDGVWQSARAD